MKNLGAIAEDELERVARAANIFHIPENEGYGVTLSVLDGRRTWVIVDQQLEVMIIGGKAKFTETYVLPIRSIENGEIQAHLGHKTVELVIDGDKARFVGEQGFSEMQLLTQVERFSTFDTTNITTAEVPPYRLGFAVLLGTALPTGVNEQDVKSLVPPLSRIKFSSSSIEISSQFKEVKSPASHTNVEAVVTGQVGEVAVLRPYLNAINRLLSQDDVGLIKLSCNIKGGNDLLFEANEWKLILRQQPSGAASYYNQVEKILEKAGHNYEIAADHIVHAKINRSEVMIEMLDGRLPIMRCTTPIISGIEKTWAVLRELDQLNESRVCTKYFMRDNIVFACVDLVCNPLIDIGTEIYALIEGAETLGGCLSSLANQLELFA